jgi:hypothetical protein
MPNIPLINQEFIEQRYSRKHIDGYIREAINVNPVMQSKIDHGIALLTEWMNGTYYESKNKRLAQLKGLDLRTLVTDIFVGVAYFQREELFTSVTAQMASRLRFSDKTEAITTVAEIMAVLCYTDAYDINKAHRMASLMVQSKIPLSTELIDFIDNSEYLPPMVCEPLPLKTNYDSGYLTHNDSVLLGTGNHHDQDVCLDVLNIMNSVPLKLATDFLSTVEEDPTFELDTRDKQEQWYRFKKQSYQFYTLMTSNGNRLWLTHKYDKRGRAYAQGYHISSQGSAFKKSSLEFADEEIVTGVPNL